MDEDYYYTVELLEALRDAQIPFHYEGEECVMLQYGNKVIMVLDKDKMMKHVAVIPKGEES